VLSSRGDSMEVRMASCVLASLVAQLPKAAEAASSAQAGPITVGGVRVAA